MQDISMETKDAFCKPVSDGLEQIWRNSNEQLQDRVQGLQFMLLNIHVDWMEFGFINVILKSELLSKKLDCNHS